MACCVLYDDRHDLACLYCSTTDVAFGPVLYGTRDGIDAGDRLEAFLRWIDSDACPWFTYKPEPMFGPRRDPRILPDAELARAYGDWLAQEAAQAVREAHAEEVQS